jgi:hypothetical protein
MEANLEAHMISKPRCPSCGKKLVYEVKMEWFFMLLKKFYAVRKFFCVNCMSGRYVWGKGGNL